MHNLSICFSSSEFLPFKYLCISKHNSMTQKSLAKLGQVGKKKERIRLSTGSMAMLIAIVMSAVIHSALQSFGQNAFMAVSRLTVRHIFGFERLLWRIKYLLSISQTNNPRVKQWIETQVDSGLNWRAIKAMLSINTNILGNECASHSVLCGGYMKIRGCCLLD